MIDYDAFIFDLDGTIYLGERLIDGARDVVLGLRRAGKRVVFLSNKPIANRSEYAQKLTTLGIETQTEDVMNSSFVAAQFFAREMPRARIYVIGEMALIDELVAAGLNLSERKEDTDVVLISLDRELTYEKIHFAYHAGKIGAQIWATNPDLVCPMPNDEIIDAGATIAAIEALLRRPIDGIIGKPSPIMSQAIIGILGVRPERCLMIGDRIETDIKMGKDAGMATALVLTGVTDRVLLEASDIRPDFVLESVGNLFEVLASKN